jgi:TnpA family transposase
MLQGAQSIQAGRISPSTILRKLGSASRKNKLYYAFRELGRVLRTALLLEYYYCHSASISIDVMLIRNMDAGKAAAKYEKRKNAVELSCEVNQL